MKPVVLHEAGNVCLKFKCATTERRAICCILLHYIILSLLWRQEARPAGDEYFHRHCNSAVPSGRIAKTTMRTTSHED